MSTIEDKYPTRLEGFGQILSRSEPVVHSPDAAARGPLSEEALASYDENGFLLLEDFYDMNTVETLREELDRLRGSEEVRQSQLAVTEPMSGETRFIYGVQTVSEILATLARDKRLLSMVEQVLGSGVYLHQSRLNMNPGFRGKEFYWHSDFETWHAEDGMRHMRAVSCSIALTDNNEFNAPMMVLPGSHKYFCQCTGVTPERNYEKSLQKQDAGLPSDEQLTWLAEHHGIVSPKGQAGSVLIFDSNLMHGSSANITPYPRQNALFVYNSIENTLVEPFASTEERPWFLGNREPDVLEPLDFAQALEELKAQYVKTT